MNNNSSNSIVENDQQLQQLIREAEEQRYHRLELELQLGRIGIDPPSEHEQNIRKLWSEISRVRRNDPSLSTWLCDLPQFHETNLFVSWCRALHQSKYLETLELSSKWVLLDDVAKAVAKGIQQTTVETLVLKSTTREDATLNNWSILYQALRFSQTIKQLTLSCVPLHYDLGEHLLLPQSLKELTLNRVSLTEPGATALGKAIGQSKLESLHVWQERMEEILLRSRQTSTPPSFYADLVCEVLRESSSLIELDLHGGKWGTSSMATFASGMKKNVSLKTLSFERCLVNNDGTDILFYLGLKRNVTLMHLTLNGCGVGDGGIRWMTENWHATSSLQELTLINNKIGPAGVRVLLDALRGLPSMQKLDLGNNKGIGYEGLRMIGDDLIHQPYLTDLSLDKCATWNDFHDPKRVRAQKIAQQQAVQALVEGIHRNQQIKSLNLVGIRFPRHARHEIHFYVGLNICGRHLLSTHHELDTGVWSYILAKCQRQDRHQQANLTYFFLKERPDLVPSAAFRTPSLVPTTPRPTQRERPKKRLGKSKHDWDVACSRMLLCSATLIEKS